MQKAIWFACGLLSGLTALSITKASVLTQRVTDDTAIYQRLSEIRVKKEAKLDFDSDISQLSRIENRYSENLPSLSKHKRLKNVLQRVSQQKYSPSSQGSVAKAGALRQARD